MESHGLRECFVSQLWIKSCECPRPEVTDSANHPNSGNKDRCLSPYPLFFCMSMCLRPFWLLCFSLCLVHIIRNHLLISSASFVVSIMESQCYSHAMALKPQLKQMHILNLSQFTAVHFLHVARLRCSDSYGSTSLSFRKVGSAVKAVCLRACVTSLVPLPPSYLFSRNCLQVSGALLSDIAATVSHFIERAYLSLGVRGGLCKNY